MDALAAIACCPQCHTLNIVNYTMYRSKRRMAFMFLIQSILFLLIGFIIPVFLLLELNCRSPSEYLEPGGTCIPRSILWRLYFLFYQFGCFEGTPASPYHQTSV
jgi:hypothetical protein